MSTCLLHGGRKIKQFFSTNSPKVKDLLEWNVLFTEYLLLRVFERDQNAYLTFVIISCYFYSTGVFIVWADKDKWTSYCSLSVEIINIQVYIIYLTNVKGCGVCLFFHSDYRWKYAFNQFITAVEGFEDSMWWVSAPWLDYNCRHYVTFNWTLHKEKW